MTKEEITLASIVNLYRSKIEGKNLDGFKRARDFNISAVIKKWEDLISNL